MSEPRPANGGTLVYEQAHQGILKLIDQRNYMAGDRIPSERDLSERLGVHRMTVRKAIDKLVREGALERRGTSGTYIPAPVIMRPVSAHLFSHSISEIVRNCGGQPGSKLLFFEQRDASLRVADKLKVEAGDPLIVIKRLRIVDDLPFCVETIWLPSSRVPGLAADDLYGDSSLYALLEERYGIKTKNGTTTISASPTSAQDAEILGLKRGESALVIHSVVTDPQERPIEYLTSLNHPRRVMFTLE